jgi:hypothetical protein
LPGNSRVVREQTSSPFEKGGLRGIFSIKSPLTPLFQRGGTLIGGSSTELAGKAGSTFEFLAKVEESI